MEMQFWGAAGTVTGSCTLIKTGKYNLMVDCGLFQGSKVIKERNYNDFPFNPADIDVVILTHAHIDHSGLIPKLYRHGYKGKVFASPATIDLCSVLLPDCAHIQEMEVERKNRKLLRAGLPELQPIYTVDDAYWCLPKFSPLEFTRQVEILPDIQVRLMPAGHILGAACVEMVLQSAASSTTIVFSGDLGNPHQPLLPNPWQVEKADYLVLESTYGSRSHQVKNNRRDELAQIIQQTFHRHGNVIIPAFTVERTQDLLVDLNYLVHENKLTPQNIIIDSPMAIAATNIFCNYHDTFDAQVKALNPGSCPLYLPGLHLSQTTAQSMALNNIKEGAIIISASGMCDAGRIKHHLKHHLWRSECSVVMVGYQAVGTLGRRLLDGAPQVMIHGEEVVVRAAIHSLEGFSAHADQQGLISWVSNLRDNHPQMLLLNHGEPESASTLQQLLLREHGLPAHVPSWGESIQLETRAGGAEQQVSRPTRRADVQPELESSFERVQAMFNQLTKQGIPMAPELQAQLRQLEDKLREQLNS